MCKLELTNGIFGFNYIQSKGLYQKLACQRQERSQLLKSKFLYLKKQNKNKQQTQQNPPKSNQQTEKQSKPTRNSEPIKLKSCSTSTCRMDKRKKKKGGRGESYFFYLFLSAVKCQESFKIIDIKVKRNKKIQFYHYESNPLILHADFFFFFFPRGRGSKHQLLQCSLFIFNCLFAEINCERLDRNTLNKT